MRYTIEGFSQTEAVKFRRTEIVKDSKGNDKEKVVTLDCTDLVILRWFVDFYPKMMKVEVNGQQYAWVDYKSLIKDVPLIGIKKRALAIRLRKLVDFKILKHHTIKNGGTFSYYGFGSAYVRLIDSSYTSDAQNGSGGQWNDEGVVNGMTTPVQQNDVQIDSSIKDSSAKESDICAKHKKSGFKPPSREDVRKFVKEKGYHFDPDHFFDYYEASDWHLQGGKKITRWKQCCVTWEKNANKESGGGQHQSKIDLSPYEQTKVGSIRINNGVTEVYQADGTWKAQEKTYNEGEDFDDIPY